MTGIREVQIILFIFLVANEVGMIGGRTLFNYIRRNMDPSRLRHTMTPPPQALSGLKRKIMQHYLGNIGAAMYIIVTLLQSRAEYLDVMPWLQVLFVVEAVYIAYLLSENLLCNPLKTMGDPHMFAVRYYALRNKKIICWIYPALERVVYYSSFIYLVIIGGPLLFR